MRNNLILVIVFEETSLYFQKQYTTLIGQVDRENMLKSSIKKLAELKGKRLVQFLEEAICYVSDLATGTPCMTLERFEESNVQYKGTLVSSKDVASYPVLSSYVNGYVNEILKVKFSCSSMQAIF